MEKEKTGSIGGFLLAITILVLAVTACPTKEEPPTRTASTPIPEKREEMRAYDIRKASDEIKNNIFPKSFLRCDEEQKERWFTLYENNGEKQLFEFVHNRNENSVFNEKLWKFVPEGILKSDRENKIDYLGNIVFTLFDADNENKENFLFKYEKEKNQWGNGENFDESKLRKYKLPTQIRLRKKKNIWEYEGSPGTWTTQAPFKKPAVPCEVLKERGSLQRYNSSLFGAEQNVASKNLPCPLGYLNVPISALLRSAPRRTDETKLSAWRKDARFEILDIIEGEEGVSDKSTVWYKVKIISGECAEPTNCAKVGYLHSSVVSCPANP